MAVTSCRGVGNASRPCANRAGAGRTGFQAGKQVRGSKEREAAPREVVDALNSRSPKARDRAKGLTCRSRTCVTWATLLQPRSVMARAKKELHPEFYPEAKVYCNGEEVISMGGTQPEYVVDIWSGNHPFYQGAGGAVVVDEGRVNRFQRRYGNLGFLSNVETVSGQAKKKKE
eukprot:scaffold287_cov337-Pavlova_lutheri.AAC.251